MVAQRDPCASPTLLALRRCCHRRRSLGSRGSRITARSACADRALRRQALVRRPRPARFFAQRRVGALARKRLGGGGKRPPGSRGALLNVLKAGPRVESAHLSSERQDLLPRDPESRLRRAHYQRCEAQSSANSPTIAGRPALLAAARSSEAHGRRGSEANIKERLRQHQRDADRVHIPIYEPARLLDLAECQLRGVAILSLFPSGSLTSHSRPASPSSSN